MTSRPRSIIVFFAFAISFAAALPTRAQTTAADYLKQGNQHFNNAEWDQAIASFQAALKLDPTYSDAQLVLALSYMLDGKLDLARAGAIKYESMKPNDPGGYVAQSQAASGLNRFAEAVQAAQTAIRLNPDRSNLAAAYFQLGYNEYMLGKTQEADQAYQTLKTVDPDSAQSLYKAIQRLEAEKKSKTAPTATPAASKPAPDPAKQSGLDDRNAHIAQEVAAIMPFEKLSYSDKAFLLQYRDFSPENKKAADDLWAKIRAQEKDGQALLRIPKALVISSTKTTIDVALMSDNQQAKAADTHVILSKPLISPPARGSSITIYGVITSYTAKPFLFTVERAQLTPPGAQPPATAAPASAKSAPPAASLPDLPDAPAARTAIQSADLISASDLTLNDVIFVLQYRDASTANQAAAKKIWSEVLAREQGGSPLQISNALVISSTRTTVDLAMSDDCKRAKKADTHLVLAKPLAAPASAGLVTNISGVITSYKVSPIMLTIERGELLKTASTASATQPPSASTQPTQPKPAPAAAPVPAGAAAAPTSTAGNWISYKNPAGNFGSRLPSQPKDTINATGGDQVSHTLEARDDSSAYTIVYVYSPSEQTINDATYGVFRDNFLKGLPTCQVITESEPSPIVRGYVGHSYRLNCRFSETKTTIIGDLYWGRHFAYAVMAIFPTATFDPPLAKTFVDSFVLVDPSK